MNFLPSKSSFGGFYMLKIVIPISASTLDLITLARAAYKENIWDNVVVCVRLT